ncbi:MAG: STAS/SEC14 domain-containing protein [Cyclobacteriaceae bacterium]
MESVTAQLTTNFIVQKEITGNTFSLDKETNISKIAWSGKVNLPIASELLQLAGDSVEFSGFTRLLIDRSQLDEFDTEARLWIKNLLKTRAKKLSRKVEKLAIINAKSAMGSIFSNMMASTISLIIPNMKMKRFENIDDAERWLLELT